MHKHKNFIVFLCCVIELLLFFKIIICRNVLKTLSPEELACNKIRFSREKLIIRHVFTCLSKHIIIYIYIFSTIYFVEKMIREFPKVWNHVQIYIHCSIAK